jgi:hypothetical protein
MSIIDPMRRDLDMSPEAVKKREDRKKRSEERLLNRIKKAREQERVWKSKLPKWRVENNQ